jgi:tripartite-type tricarboxylate transporter receptor subunit TctC
MFCTRRAALRSLFCSALAAACISPNLHAEEAWPSYPIRLIVPSEAGGSPDILCRVLAAALAQRLGQAVVVENRPGAGGNIGIQLVAHSKPDGYTLGYGNIATLSINRTLFSHLPYDPDRDLAPVIEAASGANLLVVNVDLPVRSVAELIAYAQAHPGKLTMGSAGLGTTSHLGGELFKSMEHLQIQHVPYRGSPQAQQDLMAGNVQLMFDNIPALLTSVRAGRMRALAVTSATRSELAPDVPTMQEQGVAGYEVQAWGGFVLPAGTPQPIVDRFNREFNALLQDPQVRSKLLSVGFAPAGGTPQQFRTLMDDEAVKWGKVVKESGAHVD